MTTTFLKRQKEMKRQEKQRTKAERRAQKKLASRAKNELPAENIDSTGDEALSADITAAPEPEPQN